MATSAEIDGTEFFYAFGYHVPENSTWSAGRRNTRSIRTTEVLWDSGHTDSLSRGYVDDLLEGVPVPPDGTVQVVASKLLTGPPDRAIRLPGGIARRIPMTSFRTKTAESCERCRFLPRC